MRFIRISYAFVSRLGIFALALVLFSAVVLTYAVEWQPHSKPILGVFYNCYQDDTLTIVSELEQMKAVGFKIVSIPYLWVDNPQDPVRVKTEVLFEKATQLGLKVYVRQPDPATLEAYLNQYASKIAFFQTINEIDAQFMKEWAVPGELIAFSEKNALTIKKFNPNIKTVASFSTPLFPNLITETAKHVDIIALDIYEQIQLDTFPIQMQTMLTLSGKQTIWIGEFGYATLNDQQQADFIQKGLNLFQKNSVETVIIWGWKPLDSSLNIKDRQAQNVVKEYLNLKLFLVTFLLYPRIIGGGKFGETETEKAPKVKK